MLKLIAAMSRVTLKLKKTYVSLRENTVSQIRPIKYNMEALNRKTARTIVYVQYVYGSTYISGANTRLCVYIYIYTGQK